MRPPPTYLIFSPTKKLVTPTPFVIPSITRPSKKTNQYYFLYNTYTYILKKQFWTFVIIKINVM